MEKKTEVPVVMDAMLEIAKIVAEKRKDFNLKSFSANCSRNGDGTLEIFQEEIKGPFVISISYVAEKKEIAIKATPGKVNGILVSNIAKIMGDEFKSKISGITICYC